MPWRVRVPAGRQVHDHRASPASSASRTRTESSRRRSRTACRRSPMPGRAVCSTWRSIPSFARNQTIYWSYSEPQADGANNTAVAKAKLVDGAQPRLENVQVIYHQKPSLRSPLHFGSRLVFARDGTLFVTQGERSILPGRVQAQDLKSGLGKIVRINTDGIDPEGQSLRRPHRCASRRSGPTATATCRARSCIQRPASCGSWSTGRRAATRSTSPARAGTMAGRQSPTASSMGPCEHQDRRGRREGRHGTADLLLGSGDRAGRAHVLHRATSSRNGRAASSPRASTPTMSRG